MSEIINIYCDESCHLENDHQNVMVLGALWLPRSKWRSITTRINEIKKRHKVAAEFEIKWTKVSQSKVQFYLDLIDYFFDDDDLHFRAVVIPDKSKLNHEAFAQDHHTWYFKMYFRLLAALIDPESCHRIYLDIKDTRSGPKVRQLQDVLCNANYDFSRSIIEKVQTVRSHEALPLQIADLLIGALSYANRGLRGNPGKLCIVERIKERTQLSLTRSTLLKESKLNIFVWQADWNK